jgi:hypothetical protein
MTTYDGLSSKRKEARMGRSRYWPILSFLILLQTVCYGSSNSGRAMADLNSFKVAIQQYQMENRFRFPDMEEGLKAISKYLNVADIPSDPWGHPYVYIHPAVYSDQPYDLYSIGRNEIDEKGEGDDISAWKDLPAAYFDIGRVLFSSPVYWIIFTLIVFLIVLSIILIFFVLVIFLIFVIVSWIFLGAVFGFVT